MFLPPITQSTIPHPTTPSEIFEMEKSGQHQIAKSRVRRRISILTISRRRAIDGASNDAMGSLSIEEKILRN
jgi:hypothetical protein